MRFPGNQDLRVQYRKICAECDLAIRQFELFMEHKVIDAGSRPTFRKSWAYHMELAFLTRSSSRDETANVNFFTTTSYTHYKTTLTGFG